jgi:SAM-dependent methyltransferase
LIRADLALPMVQRAGRPGLVCDEEALPFGHGRLDLIVSLLGLHSVNDVPGALVQMRAALRPDGLLLAALPGGRTLVELRHALTAAELEVTGGAAARIAPFMDVRDAGMLLQRAGFALPIVDSETITVTYGDALTLMRELRAMGESGPLAERTRPFLRRDVLVRAAEIYVQTFADARGRLPATFEILFLTGWAPDPSQQQPARRGSGQARLAEAFGVPPEAIEGQADPHRDG